MFTTRLPGAVGALLPMCLLAACRPDGPAASSTRLPYGTCEVVHVDPAAAPEGSGRYFKVHLELPAGAHAGRTGRELRYFFDYGFRQNLWLTNGRDSVNPDVYFHEASYGLSGKTSLFVGFPDEVVPGGVLTVSGPLAGEGSYDIDPRATPAIRNPQPL